MIAEDNIIDIFLFNPIPNIFSVITNKEIAIKMLRKQKDTAAKLYMLRYCGDTINIKKIAIMALEENNTFVFYKLSDRCRNMHFYAAQYGRTKELEYMNKTDTDWNQVACGAAKGGHRDILTNAITKGANRFKQITAYAAEGGNRELMNELITTHNITGMDYIACHAARGGHNDIVYSIIDEVDDIDEVANYAAQGNNREIIDYLIEEGVNSYATIASNAALNGHIVIINHIIDKGMMWLSNRIFTIDHRNIMDYVHEAIDDYRWIISCAEGHHSLSYHVPNKKMIEELHKRHKKWLNKIAFSVAQGGNSDIVNELIDVGASNFNMIACGAIIGGHIELVEEMIDMGANNWKKMLKYAKHYNRLEILYTAIENTQ